MTKEQLEEMGYSSEEEFVADLLGIEENELEDWLDSYDPD